MNASETQVLAMVVHHAEAIQLLNERVERLEATVRQLVESMCATS